MEGEFLRELVVKFLSNVVIALTKITAGILTLMVLCELVDRVVDPDDLVAKNLTVTR